MKINYALISRILIAILFVIAGMQKLMNFSGTTEFIGSIGIPFPALIALLVIIVEIPVALAYAWGYRVCAMGSILIGFTILTIFVIHFDFSVGDNMMMALKNIAIIGGILATIGNCECKTCSVKR